MTKIPLVKGNKVILEIESLNHAGEGVGRYNGFTVFVPWAVPGDRVQAEIITLQRNYARGLIKNMENFSPYRQPALCPYHGTCGGCQLQNLQYSEQLKQKRMLVAEPLRRIGGISAEVAPVLGMNEPWYYRNKVQYPVVEENGQLKMGFFQRRSHQVVDIRRCIIQHPAGEHTAAVVRKMIEKFNVSIYNEKNHNGLLRHVVIRTSFDKREVLVLLVTNGIKIPAKDRIVEFLAGQIKGLVGIVQNINTRRGNTILGGKNRLLFGRDHVYEELDGLSFKISAGSFFQVNPVQAEVLFQSVVNFAELTGAETVLDLYCGSGSIALFLSRRAARVIGIEAYLPAVADAQNNASVNGITNVEFHHGSAEELMPALAARGLQGDVMVVDPPRRGCDQKLLTAMTEMQPQSIIYVSCNPATLARDLNLMTKTGYKVKNVQPVDMFPQTAHVESIVKLARS